MTLYSSPGLVLMPLPPPGPECAFGNGGYFIPLCLSAAASLSHSLNVPQFKLIQFTMFRLPHSFPLKVNASHQAIISLLLPQRHRKTFPSGDWCAVNHAKWCDIFIFSLCYTIVVLIINSLTNGYDAHWVLRESPTQQVRRDLDFN